MIRATLLALPVALMSAAADARPPTLMEERGHSNCAKAFQSEVPRLVRDSRYLVNQGERTTMYYLNGFSLTPEGRQDVRMACQTERRGHRILSARVEPGQYAPATRVTIEVANQ